MTPPVKKAARQLQGNDVALVWQAFVFAGRELHAGSWLKTPIMKKKKKKKTRLSDSDIWKL